jgi:hypothetical protein
MMSSKAARSYSSQPIAKSIGPHQALSGDACVSANNITQVPKAGSEDDGYEIWIGGGEHFEPAAALLDLRSLRRVLCDALNGLPCGQGTYWQSLP